MEQIVSKPRRLKSLILGHFFLFHCFRSEKNQNLMREGGEKTFKKKNIEHIFEKGNKGDEKNKPKKHNWKNIFYLSK